MSRLTVTWSMVCLVLVLAAGAWADPNLPAQPADTCENQLPGDANGDGLRDIDDAYSLKSFLCNGLTPPDPLANGDANGDCIIDWDDVQYIYDHVANWIPFDLACTCVAPQIGSAPEYCCNQHAGDVNGDMVINIGDAIYLVTYLYHNGPTPPTPANADVNGDCEINYEDLHILYCMFGGVCIPEFELPPVLCACPDPVPDKRDTCDVQMPGDADGNGVIEREDVLYLFAFLCQDGPAPEPMANGDPNGDCIVDSLDVEYLMDALLHGGPAPVECTCIEQPTGACYVNYCAYENPGDVDGNGTANIGDIAALVNFLFKGGPAPNPLANGDVNGDCLINYDDYTCMMQAIIPEWPCRVDCTCIFPLVEYPCGGALSGDANGDLLHNVGDAVYIINFVFRSGPAPVPYAVYSGDPNGDCAVNVGDAVYMVNYVFRSGPVPVGCFDWLEDCGSPVH